MLWYTAILLREEDILSCYVLNILRLTISANQKKMEVINTSLKQQLQELQEKVRTSEFGEQSEICTLNRQLVACNDKLHQEAVAKEKLKAEIETIKGTF